jgi:hypothetical protein
MAAPIRNQRTSLSTSRRDTQITVVVPSCSKELYEDIVEVVCSIRGRRLVVCN